VHEAVNDFRLVAAKVTPFVVLERPFFRVMDSKSKVLRSIDADATFDFLRVDENDSPLGWVKSQRVSSRHLPETVGTCGFQNLRADGGDGISNLPPKFRKVLESQNLTVMRDTVFVAAQFRPMLFVVQINESRRRIHRKIQDSNTRGSTSGAEQMSIRAREGHENYDLPPCRLPVWRWVWMGVLVIPSVQWAGDAN
jgi:hypothetical protein